MLGTVCVAEKPSQQSLSPRPVWGKTPGCINYFRSLQARENLVTSTSLHQGRSWQPVQHGLLRTWARTSLHPDASACLPWDFPQGRGRPALCTCTQWPARRLGSKSQRKLWSRVPLCLLSTDSACAVVARAEEALELRDSVLWGTGVSVAGRALRKALSLSETTQSRLCGSMGISISYRCWFTLPLLHF